MRFTKVPLIATLAAGALSLLVVLPALAQNDTRGRVIDGNNFMVEVYKTRAEATDSTAPVAAPSTTYFNGVLYASNADTSSARSPRTRTPPPTSRRSPTCSG